MKLTLFLSMGAVIQLRATETYSRMTHPTLKPEDVTISDALKVIENELLNIREPFHAPATETDYRNRY